MAGTTASLQRNLSRLELALGIVVIAVLIGLFMARMQAVELAAEEAIVATRVQDMRARLMTLRTRFVSGDAAPMTIPEIVRHIGRGEMRTFTREHRIDWTTVAPGEWIYIADSGLVAYRSIAGDALPGAHGEPPLLRFKLEAHFADTKAGDGAARRVVGARLVRMAEGRPAAP